VKQRPFALSLSKGRTHPALRPFDKLTAQGERFLGGASKFAMIANSE